MNKKDMIFQERLNRHHDELRWLYMELYGNDAMFAELCDQIIVTCLLMICQCFVTLKQESKNCIIVMQNE